ncbi:hypothetical protein [Acinetobacter brisouii]
MLTPEKILEIIKKIVNGDYTASQLENLYNNAIRLGYTDIECTAKDALILNGNHEHKRKFLAPIQEKVKNLVYEIAEQHNWLNFQDNNVGNGIKSGGLMINGSAIANYYFSYKQKGWTRSVSFAATQTNVKSDIYYSVHSPNLMEEIHCQNLDDALFLFCSELDEQMK